ncbi:phosphomannomutase/phosphoglucomutase [Marinicella gelatinilytica]|uniref:phosphomannomutase/phosphoglucomutase n=1 Tax=Marinicella gelatinilytica TaxID=2996017 RepID=UPI002B216502|nr:phosphomannomutase/phosphoglucomutase [Marinicella gelatinilytica]
MDIKNLLAKLNKPVNKKSKQESSEKPTNSLDLKSLLHLKPADELLWTSLALVALLLTLFFAYLTYQNLISQQVSSGLSKTAQAVADNVTGKLQTINQTAAEIVKHNPNNQDVVGLIEEQVPDTLRVLRVTEPIDGIMPDPEFPGINYATLDMLKQTSEQQQELLPEIHLYGQKNQYLNYVLIQQPEQAYVVISYPVEKLVNYDAVQVNKGEVKLVQKSGRWSTVTLKQWGNRNTSEAANEHEIKIPESNFYVLYATPQAAAGLFKLTLLGSIIATFAGVLLTVAFFLKRRQRIQTMATKTASQDKKKASHYVPRAVSEDKKHTSENQDEPQQMTHKKLPDPSIFKAYDIRGIVDKTLTRDTVMQIGQAIGTENINRGRQSLVVARDGRLSGPDLLNALIQGVKASGCDVINIGAVPTGVLYFATHHLETGSGVMLTGSHNPPEYNGLKIMLDGETLAGKLITNLYDMICEGDLLTGDGNVQELDIADDYIDYISSEIQLEKEPTVVVDSGNGIAGPIAIDVLEEIGCNVIPLHCEVDGEFPNHHPDPSIPENLEDLKATLKSVDADIGIAFDGDGDRLGVVTKSGEIIYPDRLLMLFAKDVLTRQPGSSIIFDVKCTAHLPKSIVKNGGLPIMWKTGHSFMKAKLKETGAALAGEMSGHFFFNERWFGFDDGIYAAARLLEILDQETDTPQEVFDTLPKGVSTPELKVEMAEGEHYMFMKEFEKRVKFEDAKITTIDGIRADFEDGWGLVRCSNTTPCLVIRFDADNEAALERIQEQFREQLLNVSADLELPF